MKSSPLPRRKTELKRGTPPARTELPRRAKKLSQRSKRREADAAERFVIRNAVFARDRWQCTMPAVLRAHGLDRLHAGPCLGHLTPHHLQKASGLGGYTMDNLVTLCVHHNGWVEDHPLAATELGLVRRG